MYFNHNLILSPKHNDTIRNMNLAINTHDDNRISPEDMWPFFASCMNQVDGVLIKISLENNMFEILKNKW